LLPEFDLDFLSKLLSIIVIDLVLSGDNAVVIGMASRSLPAESRRRAIIFGGAGAVGLRILFTAMAALLLDVPLLQALGAVLLIYIAFKLVRPVHETEHVSEAHSLREAIKTIIMADVVMSLDNILAVGGAAHGHLGLLLFGLALSIPILLFGSSLVARVMNRLPVLVYIGAAILVVTSVRMFFHDELVHDVFAATTPVVALVAIVMAGIVCAYGWRLASRSADTMTVVAESPSGEIKHTTSQIHTSN
jgi:YjbE family integral membrane protein